MRLACLLVLFATTCFGADKLVIHEWGTFTSLQNEQGEPLGGINVDDEPVPKFVHSLTSSVITNSPGPEELAASAFFSKGGPIPMYHPQVTMRLETPVVYFYPPKGAPQSKIDLSVTFKGGLLSQFYPMADSEGAAHLIMRQPGQYVQVKPDTTHTLTWKDLSIGTNGTGPETQDKVWLSPRAVSAASVTASNGESEKYLFYRGVGNLESPLRVMQRDGIFVLGGLPVLQPPAYRMMLRHAWLVDIRSDGKFAFKSQQTLNHPAPPDGAILGFTPFVEADYAAENLAKMRTALRDGLVQDGLFTDEAEAMLNTWEASYFKQPGMRVLYIVPKAWTDQVLPLKVSVDADVTRVMVGRIDLVRPEQRELAKTISKPEDVKKLGRFAAAILNDEQKRNPSPARLALIQRSAMTQANLVPQP